MMYLPFICLMLSLSCLIGRGWAYSTGAPPEGCWGDRPLHGNNLPQGGHILPYRIDVSETSYGPRDTIKVSILGSDDSNSSITTHAGFLLRMISSASQRGGQWAVDRRVHRYNSECGVTHKGARLKTITTVLWRAPSEHKGHLGNIQFRAIVVANFTHFWDSITSHTLTPNYPDKSDKGMLRRFQRIFSILSDEPPLQTKQTSNRDVNQGNTTTNSTIP